VVARRPTGSAVNASPSPATPELMNLQPVSMSRQRLPVAAGERRVVLSVVAPVYNETAVIQEFDRRLAAVVDYLSVSSEVLYINDGSRDDSMRLLREIGDADPRVVLIDLSRNFGKEIAMTAGLDHARGEAVIVIDSDLQDPPELIPDMLREWQAGVDVVMMRHFSREGETWLKKATSTWFYRLIGSIGEQPIPVDVGDFRLLSRRAVDALGLLPERTRFMKGLFAWVGFRQITLDYRRDARFAGETKWNYWWLWKLALEGITSFSSAPLKMVSYVGLATAVYALGAGV
jgi:glycosyltransferase involved in cell wall biosynthesis